jgi:hypothetical protein
MVWLCFSLENDICENVSYGAVSFLGIALLTRPVLLLFSMPLPRNASVVKACLSMGFVGAICMKQVLTVRWLRVNVVLLIWTNVPDRVEVLEVVTLL